MGCAMKSLFLFPAKAPMNRPDEKVPAGDHDTNYRPGLPRALSGRKVRVFGAWTTSASVTNFQARCAHFRGA
ncbi:hypothetical protein BN77_1714 [Rhizobium mesoamericanum STM3625]|uniref:Uncharacterized protein n=1 Tax=Rhizobium mesoamericanum STM3625 TaxID=1211777 RepID=K0PKX8_9HYPH|nr:hypothetical protein BN77_1714 [Rhizobium mesoamericanum STM3625]